MRAKLRLSAWAGPLTIGSFVAVAGTGILLFFHAGTGLAKAAHEVMGWLLIIGAVAHTAFNWRPFVAYFRKPLGIAIIGLMLALGVVPLCISPSSGGRSHGPRALMAVASALEKSPLHVVAQVAKSSPEALVEKLKTKGIQVRDYNQTIGEIASENNKRGFEILGHLLGPAAS